MKDKVLFIGYYDRANLGDDAFKYALPKFFKHYKIDFVTADDVGTIKSYKKYQAVLCGGGDLINEYFKNKLKEVRSKFQGLLFAYGIGVTYLELVDRGYLDMFDYIFVRNKKDIDKLALRYGSNRVFYMPDIVFKVDPPKNRKLIRSNAKSKELKTVGMFLVRNVYDKPNIVFNLTRFVEHVSKNYKVILYAFNTSGAINEDDRLLNENISMALRLNNVEADMNVYSTEEMLEKIAGLDLAVCMRLHSHIFCTIANVPFLSLCMTRKVSEFLNDIDYYHCYKLELDGCRPIGVDLDQLKNAFDKFTTSDPQDLTLKLKYVQETFSCLHDNDKINQLVTRGTKRGGRSDIFTTSHQQLYKNLQKNILRQCGHDINDHDENKWSDEICTLVARELCYCVTGLPASKYLYGTIGNIKKNPSVVRGALKWIHEDFFKDSLKHRSKFNIDYMNQNDFVGLHRSGWEYCIKNLSQLSSYNGTLLDVYVDRTFHWAKDALINAGVLPYTSPWVGFIHHTPDTHYTKHNTTEMFGDKVFIRSLNMCRGLYAMSQYMVDWIKNQLNLLGINIPVCLVYHPTCEPTNYFSYQNFLDNEDKKIINIGAWYRNPFSMFMLKTSMDGLSKCSLKGKEMSNYFPLPETVVTKDMVKNYGNISNIWTRYMCKYIHDTNYLTDLEEFKQLIVPEEFKFELGKYQEDSEDYDHVLNKHISGMIDEVRVLQYLPNDEYDRLLIENIVFLDLINCSAANTIIESIRRLTPIVIRRVEAAVEYLGEDYPLYYDDIDEVDDIVTYENIEKAYNYLKDMDKSFLTVEVFIDSIVDSEIYQSL